MTRRENFNKKELLRKIEEALKYYLENFYNTRESGCIGFDACQALASLRALLEGDAGEDEKNIRNGLSSCCEYSDSGPIFELAEISLSRLSARAKIGEAEIREAKREVLEEAIKDATETWGASLVGVFKRKLAKLKEAGTDATEKAR